MDVLCKTACSNGIIVEYVRTYQPETENTEQINGQIYISLSGCTLIF